MPPVSFDLVAQCLRDGRPADAERAARQALQAAPQDLPGLSLLSVALHRLGRADEGAEVCRQALVFHPLSGEMWGNRAVLLQAAGRMDEARHCLVCLRALDPASLLASQRLGVVTQELGDGDDALRHARRAALLNPLADATLYNLGAVRMTLGYPAAAAAAFARLAAVAPDGVAGYVQLAASLLATGETGRAAALYDRAARLNPADAAAREGRLRCLRYRVAQAAAGCAATAPGVLLRGPYQGVSGYAHMTNRLVDAVAAGGTRVHVLGLMGGEAWSSPLEAMARGKAIVSCQTPPTVEIVPGLATVNLTMFEGAQIPAAWRRCSDLHDLVIVPTQSSRLAWLARGYPEDRLRVCPLGVDPETPDGAPAHLTAPDGRRVADFSRRILNVSDFIPRKNLDGVLRVWLRATTAADDAVLILKPGKGGARTRAQFDALIRQTEAATGRALRDAAPVVVVTGTLDEDSMTGLFRAASHYWSLSHGEGWDLPMSKAGAMGLQLAAPAHSSYVDYLDETVARMIPAITGPAHLPNSRAPWPTFFGLDWWEPDEDAAADVIGRIVRGEDQRILDARTRLLERFTWRQAADRLLAVLRETGAL